MWGGQDLAVFRGSVIHSVAHCPTAVQVEPAALCAAVPLCEFQRKIAGIIRPSREPAPVSQHHFVSSLGFGGFQRGFSLLFRQTPHRKRPFKTLLTGSALLSPIVQRSRRHRVLLLPGLRVAVKMGNALQNRKQLPAVQHVGWLRSSRLRFAPRRWNAAGYFRFAGTSPTRAS